MKGKYRKRKPASALITALLLTAAVLAVTVGAMTVSVIRRETEAPEQTAAETATQEMETLSQQTQEPTTYPTVTETQEQTLPETTEETTVPETEPTVPQTTAETVTQSSGTGNAAAPSGTTVAANTGVDTGSSGETQSLPNTSSTTCKNHMQVDFPYSSSALAAGCTSYGQKYLWCPTCGEKWLVTDNTKPPLGHDEASSIVSPRYGAEGYTEHYCYRCGLVLYRDNYVPALTEPAVSNTLEPHAVSETASAAES